MRKRRAKFVANLVVYDEPHLIYLLSKKTPVVAVAIEADEQGNNYFAASVSVRNWERYRQGTVDLRYILAYATPRTSYKFKWPSKNDGLVMMDPIEGEVPEKYLPASGFFSDSHTEDFDLDRAAGDFEDKLYIDGEWSVNEFGTFYQKYSDLYFLSFTVEALTSNDTDPKALKSIEKTLSTKPFQGGGSYVVLFDEFEDFVPRDKRLSVEGITYNSPGEVRISGSKAHIQNVEEWIIHFLDRRAIATKAYKDLQGYLSKRKLLRAPARAYDFADEKYLMAHATALYEALGIDGISAVIGACKEHPLIFSKVVLSICRRIMGAANYFAEGRMSFDDPDLIIGKLSG